MATAEKIQIKDICEKVSSGGTPARNRPEYFELNGNGHLWVKSKELLEKGISDTEEKISDLGLKNSSAKIYPVNTVLVAMYGVNAGQLGWLKKPASVNQAVCALLVDHKKANWTFVYYSLLQSRQDLISQARGAAQPNLNKEMVENFEIPMFNSLETQSRIASVLAAYDDLIEINEKRIKALEEMAGRLYTEWFVKFKFPGHEKVKMIDSGTEFGLIPEGWAIKKFYDVVNNLDSKRKPISSMKRQEIQGKYPYYGAAKIIDQINDYIFDGRYLLIAEDGSVITPDGKPMMQFIDEKFWVSNHAHVVQGRLLSTEILFLRLQRFNIKSLITGSAQPKITKDNMSRILFIVPGEKVKNAFTSIVSFYFDEIFNVQKQKKELSKIRDLLIPQLVTGKRELK
jgi:type I restriction enzyme S subunit